MSQIDDGGAAFPKVGRVNSDNQRVEEMQAGMSLRDWFAGQALAGLTNDAEVFWPRAATLAYEYADAMIATRNGGQS